ncbi:protein SPA1-RELATED 3-like isoform X2 [Punica granatum]|uniref:Protein SPA1-RELATED 3-like isoform X2 n=1 Tax=Punica granatum TaxID=22663 RepID=A0A6P8E2R7_PUNGR|nr:protein SPA1-RELATED 3-like isoform X2 [Punica granatum]
MDEIKMRECLSQSCDELSFSNISLRQWLDKPERHVDKMECLHIFSQIVEIVNAAHSRRVVVNNVRPSCFSLSPFNCVSFTETASYSRLRSDSFEGGLVCEDLSEISCVQSNLVNIDESGAVRNCWHSEQLGDVNPPPTGEDILPMEASWYTSPEEVAGASHSFASDIYCLGVFLFELFCPSISREEKSRTMSSLRHRVLPPQLLLNWPREASFCLLLLHPEPNRRPRISELLQSEFLRQLRQKSEELEDGGELRERIEEQELLLEFLSLIHERKREAADKLQDVVSVLSSDIEEVRKHWTVLKEKGDICAEFPSSEHVDFVGHSAKAGSRKRLRAGFPHQHTEQSDDEDMNDGKENIFLKSSRLLKNFKKLESAYFLARSGPINQSERRVVEPLPVSSNSTVVTERSSINNFLMKEDHEERRSGWIEPFLEGLCKYVAFSKLKVSAEINQGGLLNSANLVCSLSFDRDGELFAAAGVNKRIKVFECDAILKDDRDIHYPVIEMASSSKICCVCWNTCIKRQIASSNFEGVVQVWDVTRNDVLMEMREHEKRVWSIDFSTADLTMLASGSDDGSVKLWSINQGASVATIKANANVCCVQFAPDSGRSLAFGSADCKIYYYDLRNSRFPLCTLIGHNKTVSYVKFVDSTNVVSSSTDSTLKLWDMSMSESRVVDSPLRTFSGHTNVRNFVGLSISNGYIATGSETNEQVLVYHKAFPMPSLSYDFNSTDSLSGHDSDKTAQFVSSVCWRNQSSTLVAANSTGNIKILEMV